jgi:hypothetical protein
MFDDENGPKVIIKNNKFMKDSDEDDNYEEIHGTIKSKNFKDNSPKSST